MSGWIKMHRSILNHWLYTEKRKFSKFEAWQDMLLNVNYSDNKTIIKGNLYEVKRGQSILSLDSWSKRWNWDKSSVRRFFNLLEKDKMIVIKSDNVTTHLTICKYEDYQQGENANETQTNRKRNADESQTTPIKESKENKEGKENNTSSTKNEFSQDIIKTFNSVVGYFETKPQTESQKNKWLDCIDKLNRIDGLSFDEIILIVKHAKEDSFWSKNFLSLLKLRNKNKEDIYYWNIFKTQMKPKQESNVSQNSHLKVYI